MGQRDSLLHPGPSREAEQPRRR